MNRVLKMVVFLVLLFSALFAEQIRIDDPLDFRILEQFFRTMMSDDDYGYVIDGVKPISVREFGSPEHLPLPHSPMFSSDICAMEVIEVWNRVRPKKVNITLKTTKIFNAEADAPRVEFLFINSKELLKAIESNINLFRYVLGPSLGAKDILKYIVEFDVSLSDILKKDLVLTGIVLGFGAYNSLMYSRTEMLQNSQCNPDIPPFSSRFGLLFPGLDSLREHAIFFSYINGSIQNRYQPNRTHFVHSGLGFKCTKDELNFINSQQIDLPKSLTKWPCATQHSFNKTPLCEILGNGEEPMQTAAPSADDMPSSLADLSRAALTSLDRLLDLAAERVRARVTDGDHISGKLLEKEQRAAHGLAWLATYVEALRQLTAYADRLEAEGKFGALEEKTVRLGYAEYLEHIFGGIPMNQGEFVRLSDVGISRKEAEGFRTEAIDAMIETGNTMDIRAGLAELIRHQAGQPTYGNAGLDETMEQIRNEMRRFAEDNVTPHAHEWHLNNEYIPLEVIGQMSELGVFGLTIPEAYGGMGLGKEAMCVVSEELSRAYIGVGSLGTRSEIAAELILCGGTEEQKQHWLPKIASGEILPTAVFTEPNTGSDLASLRTRAVKDGDTWKISGNKTWITHPVRADIMTLLARTNPDEPGYRGLSMFIAEKPRGTDEDPFPADGMSGGEIEVLGYRGMKEYEIAFDGFEVKDGNLLGEVEGEGFKQLMQTFEGARIQTAARALGVAQCALDLGLKYAEERIQFGKALVSFPRVSDKLALMAAEVMIARQLTYFSSWQKDSGKRCDLEAGMAKLLGARVAWAAADNALQIHGGNGFALEYPVSRVLCDARILNIFEGAAEIQAQVIARRLLETRGRN